MVQALSFGLFAVNTNIFQGQAVRHSYCHTTTCSSLIFVALNGLEGHIVIWKIRKSGLHLLPHQKTILFLELG